MIKEALKYVVEMSKPDYCDIGGEMYTDKKLSRVETEDYADAITLTTLSSLVEYIKSNVDAMKRHMFVHVTSPTSVSVFSALDIHRKRECVVKVDAKLPRISFDTYTDRELFNIALQSKFLPSADRELLLKFVGTVENGTVQEYGDDGVTQKAVIKTGIASKGDAIVPNPVELSPYRTFVELEQPISPFVFRMRESRTGGIECGIFEADGGEWEYAAMENIKDYLCECLKDVDGYTVIS